MPTPKKLSDESERDVVLSRLTGIPVLQLAKHYHISEDLVKLIIYDRSKKWGDPLIEFYRNISPYYLKNSAHLYLAFCEKDVLNRELVDVSRDERVFDIVRESIYVPIIDGVVKETKLGEFMRPSNNYEILLGGVFGPSIGYLDDILDDIVERFLAESLEKFYHSDKKFKLSEVAEDLQEIIFYRIKHGGASIFQEKAELIDEMLSTLNKKEEKVIRLRFGLDGKLYTLKEVGRCFNVSKERVRQIEAKALRKLRHPVCSRKLRPIYTGLITYDDFESLSLK